MLKREDPTFDWRVDQETGQTLMSGMGMLHLEVKQYRLEHDLRLKVRVGKPRVSYRETLRQPVRNIKGQLPRQLSAVQVSFEPVPIVKAQPPAVTALDAEDIPKAFREAARQGVEGALQSGEFGYPVINVNAHIDGYTMDAEQSNEVAFQAAGADAVHKAFRENFVLLEPVMHLEVTVPEEYIGPVTADLSARRAEITQILDRGKLRVAEALVPLARMFDYSDKIRSLTQGRASWTMEPHSYAPAPPDVARGLLGIDDMD
jgi:elongation factor G